MLNIFDTILNIKVIILLLLLFSFHFNYNFSLFFHVYSENIINIISCLLRKYNKYNKQFSKLFYLLGFFKKMY